MKVENMVGKDVLCRVATALIPVLVLGGAACKSGRECQPGASRVCACPEGGEGTQVCGQKGTWQVCIGCPSCGDGTCDPTETHVTCPEDCPISVCGDGHVQVGEDCDGVNLNGHDCLSLDLGFTGGDLGCTATCAFDTEGCVALPGCGNGVVEPGEACDGRDLDGLTCGDFGHSAGLLACRPDCSTPITAGCHDMSVCGDGVASDLEDCDGFDLHGLVTCSDWSGGFTGGSLACTPHCTLDFSDCQGDLCAAWDLRGNGYCDPCELYGGAPDPDCASCEVADGDCVSWLAPGLGGALSSCMYLTGHEDPDCGTCGDGEMNPQIEWCDTAVAETPGRCSDFGFSAGAVGCAENCTLDISGCSNCGDDQIDGPEACDGADLGGATCTDHGFSGGQLACTASCQLDFASCTGGCGNGLREGDEVCDGGDVGTSTCQSCGYVGGDLVCNGTCTDYDEVACYGPFVVDDSHSFAWLDISTTGSPMALEDDEVRGPLAIGFPFYLFGVAHTELFVSSNGFLTLGSDGQETENACPLGSDSNLPDFVVAVMWDDLDPHANGDLAYFQSFASCPLGPAEPCFVVQYQGYHHYSLDTPALAGTFQVILFASGSVLMQYLDAGDLQGLSATTGIKGPGGLAAEYGCNSSGYLSDNLAVCFAKPGSGGC